MDATAGRRRRGHVRAERRGEQSREQHELVAAGEVKVRFGRQVREHELVVDADERADAAELCVETAVVVVRQIAR
jgi:hypothetical protein